MNADFLRIANNYVKAAAPNGFDQVSIQNQTQLIDDLLSIAEAEGLPPQDEKKLNGVVAGMATPVQVRLRDAVRNFKLGEERAIDGLGKKAIYIQWFLNKNLPDIAQNPTTEGFNYWRGSDGTPDGSDWRNPAAFYRARVAEVNEQYRQFASDIRPLLEEKFKRLTVQQKEPLIKALEQLTVVQANTVRTNSSGDGAQIDIPFFPERVQMVADLEKLKKSLNP